MNMVALICGIHIWWGASLLVGIPLPRPFGALEPFFILPFANDFTVGLMLFTVGLLPLTTSAWPRSFWCLSCLMIPQQLILMWGLLLGGIDVIITRDGRAWYALGYTGLLFIFHARELCDEFVTEMIRRGGQKGNGP